MSRLCVFDVLAFNFGSELRSFRRAGDFSALVSQLFWITSRFLLTTCHFSCMINLEPINMMYAGLKGHLEFAVDIFFASDQVYMKHGTKFLDQTKWMD